MNFVKLLLKRKIFLRRIKDRGTKEELLDNALSRYEEEKGNKGSLGAYLVAADFLDLELCRAKKRNPILANWYPIIVGGLLFLFTGIMYVIFHAVPAVVLPRYTALTYYCGVLVFSLAALVALLVTLPWRSPLEIVLMVIQFAVIGAFAASILYLCFYDYSDADTITRMSFVFPGYMMQTTQVLPGTGGSAAGSLDTVISSFAYDYSFFVGAIMLGSGLCKAYREYKANLLVGQ